MDAGANYHPYHGAYSFTNAHGIRHLLHQSDIRDASFSSII